MIVFGSIIYFYFFFFFSSRRRHTRFSRDWSSDVCSSDLPVARRDRAVPGMLEKRGREELQAGLVLREIDEAALSGAATALERGEHGDDAIADRDVVDVRPVEDHRRPLGLAQELIEAGERGQLAAVPGMLRVRAGLSLVAAGQDDDVRLRAAQR